MDHEHRTGFLPEPTLDDHFVFGSGKLTERLGATPLMPGGKGWEKYLPAPEDQSNRYIEPQDCTIANALKAWETVANRLKKLGLIKDEHFPRDCAERFNACLAAIGPTGGSPHRSAEAIRTNGVIHESKLPFNDLIRTWDEFYSPMPMTQDFKNLARATTKYVKLGQEWLWNDESDQPKKTPEQKSALIAKALERGVICVSMYAWKENGGLYYKDPDDQDCHWTLIYEQDGYDKCFDTYAPYKKRIRPYTDYYCAKLYTMAQKTQAEIDEDEAKLKGLLEKLVDALKRFIIFLKRPIGMPSTDNITEIPIEPPVRPVVKSKAEKLYDTAYACIGRNMRSGAAPQEFGCVDAFRGVWKEAFGEDIAPGVLNTVGLDAILAKRKDFKAVLEKELKPGDVQIALTQGDVHGHVLVRGKQDSMSNDSDTGLWKTNYHNANVQLVFRDTLGLKLHYYRPVDSAS